MKEKTLLFLAAFMVVFLSACSSPFGSNEIPADMPAEVEIPIETDILPMDESPVLDEVNLEAVDQDMIVEVNNFDAVIDAEEELSELETEVDGLFDDYEAIFE